MKEKELESEHNSPNPMFLEIGQTKYTIHPHHVDFFEKLRSLPVKHRIILMGLSVGEVRAYIGQEKHEMLAKVRYHLSKTWYWKETGELVDINEDTIPEVSFTVKEMLSNRRSIEVLEKIIEFFEGPDREVYTKSDE